MRNTYQELRRFFNLECRLPSDIVDSVYRAYDATCAFDLKTCYYDEVLAEFAMIADDMD